MILTGLAGTGKSFLIHNLRAYFGHKCKVAAYFGLAAHNIKGSTLHSFLHLPVRIKNLVDLQGSSLGSLQENLSEVEYLIIDEFSVIGLRLFSWIDRRCRQAKCRVDLPFGGLNIILVGDIAQLPPVLDKPLYHKKPISEAELQGSYMYNMFDTVVQLTVNQRCHESGQESFRQLLLRLRNGNSTIDDWKLLLSCSVTRVKENFSAHSKLCFTNEAVDANNAKCLKNMKEPIIQIHARHSNKQASKCSSEDMGGLQKVIRLCRGARVMLTKNLWTEQGLCNGALGVVRNIIYKDNEIPPALPIAIVVEFDGYEGPSFGTAGCVPILPITNCSEAHGQFCERQQLPLKLAWSMTIHKSQGLTLSKAEIDLGDSEKISGLSYVALSRVRALGDLVLHPMSFDRLSKIRNSKGFQFRIDEEERLFKLAKETHEKYSQEH